MRKSDFLLLGEVSSSMIVTFSRLDEETVDSSGFSTKLTLTFVSSYLTAIFIGQRNIYLFLTSH